MKYKDKLKVAGIMFTLISIALIYMSLSNFSFIIQLSFQQNLAILTSILAIVFFVLSR